MRDRVAYLKEAVDSVLAQDPGPGRMEIILIDNSVGTVDFAAVLPPEIIARVRIHRHATPLEMIPNWNACLRLARGELIHLLHDDDWVGAGFYHEIEKLAQAYPDLHFFAVRTQHVDSSGILMRVADRLPEWEKPSRDPSIFFHANHIQCPAVVVRRSCYERAGGFIEGLSYVADCEMWARAISVGGGVLSPKPLAFYRVHEANATSGLLTSGRWLRELGHLRDRFAELYRSFDEASFNRYCSNLALARVRSYETEGLTDAAAANRTAWSEVMPAAFRRRYRVQALVLRLLKPPLKALGLHLDRA